MYKFSLRNFRGFHEPHLLDIRPITLLVGENSAGKSSFAAALKYMLDFIAQNESPSFNKDPFQLGTFQQITHYRGGKAGRAREFSLCLSSDVPIRSPRSEKGPLQVFKVNIDLSFTNVESQASISSVVVDVNNESLNMLTEGDKIRLEYHSETGRVYHLDDIGLFPRIARSEITRYWAFFLRDIQYRIQTPRSSAQESLPEEVVNKISFLGRCTTALITKFSGEIFASSAIRTKPLRTYTPGAESPDGEGSHVPFEIAKLYRARNKEAWRRIKISLEDYGTNSELFRDISIKSFGTTASDPFQIQFSSDGPKMNIVDLGYGVSQVLPIVYSVAMGDRGSRYMIQQPEVHLHPRAQAALGQYFIDEYLNKKKEFILETHSDFIVDRVRRGVQEGLLNSQEVSILFFERRRLENVITQIEIGADGSPVDAPPSYRSFFIDEQMRNIGVL